MHVASGMESSEVRVVVANESHLDAPAELVRALIEAEDYLASLR